MILDDYLSLQDCKKYLTEEETDHIKKTACFKYEEDDFEGEANYFN